MDEFIKNQYKTTIEKWPVQVVESTTGQITIFYDGQGGPIMSGGTFEEAKAKFIEAMGIAQDVRFMINN